MTTIIFSNGVSTIRKKNQSIKSHIKNHEKNWWISEYMKIAECDIKEAIQAYEKMEAVQE